MPYHFCGNGPLSLISPMNCKFYQHFNGILGFVSTILNYIGFNPICKQVKQKSMYKLTFSQEKMLLFS